MTNSPAALLPEFLQLYPFQPATALWRAVEIATIAEAGLPEGRGLDLGCGDGLLTSLLISICGQRPLIGLDPDDNEIRLARATALYRDLLTADGDSIPLPDSSVDWVLSNSVLEHIEDVGPVLREVSRVLRPRGEFVLTVPSPVFHELLRGPRLSGSARRRKAYLANLDRRVAHRFYWDEDRWGSELSKAGLQLDSAVSYLDQAQTRRWETLSRLTAGLLVFAFRGRRQPIEIQRTLGLRSKRRRMPRGVARILAIMLSVGVDLNATAPALGSGLLLRGRKA
jgi:ubiquinone/menaquinone biosynthesis C-methylase UbiE